MNTAKAVAGAVSAGVAAFGATLASALADGHISTGETIAIVCGTLAAAAAGYGSVYAAPKNTASSAVAKPEVPPP